MALVISRGHAFDTAQFFDMFFDFESINLDTISQPWANTLLETNEIKKYDAQLLELPLNSYVRAHESLHDN